MLAVGLKNYYQETKIMPSYSRTYPPTFRFDDMESCNDFHGRVMKILEENQMSFSEGYRLIFEAGIESLEQQRVEDGRASSLESAIIKERAKTREWEKLFEDLEFLYQRKGDDEFYQWYLAQPDCDMELLEEFRRRQDTKKAHLPWSEQARSWLFKELQDGNPYQTSEIRAKAIQEGVITEDPEDWNKLRQLAWRNGMTGEADHGWWCLPHTTA